MVKEAVLVGGGIGDVWLELNNNEVRGRPGLGNDALDREIFQQNPTLERLVSSP